MKTPHFETKKTGLTVCFLLLAAAAPWGQARTAEQCAYVEERQARLACYDAIFRAPQSNKPAAPAAPPAGTANAGSAPDVDETPAAPAVAVVVETPAAPSQPAGDAKFGREDVIQNDPTQDTRLPQIEARITDIATLAFGKRQFTLDNGQVWRQIEADRKRFRESTGVTIKRAGLGSYILTTENGVSTRVSRVR